MSYSYLLLFKKAAQSNSRKGGIAMPRWPKWITAKYMWQMTHCLRIGDLVIFPRSRPTTNDLRDLKKLVLAKDKIRKFLPGYLQRIYTGFENLYREHIDDLPPRALKKLRDPDWMEKLPNSIQASLRYHRTFLRYEDDIFVNNAFAPLIFNTFIGFEYMLLRKGLLYDVYYACELWRQRGNPQLSNKTDPVCSELGIGLSERRSVQTREMHCLDMYPLATLVAYNNRHRLSRHFRKNFRAFAPVHDRFIPPMGDEIMEMDMAAFCEVQNIKRLSEIEKWEIMRRKRGISNKSIFGATCGEGVAGDAGDKIDKISYTALDLTYFFRLHWGKAGPKPAWLKRIFSIVEACPELCTVWDSIVIDDGKVYFADPIRLDALITVRALNFRHNYYSEHSRSDKTILAKSVLGYLYASGKINRYDFQEKNRGYFDELINDFVGHWHIMEHAGFAMGNPRVETFTTPEDAFRREKDLFDRGIVLSAIEDVRGKINPATHFLVQASSGDILPFAEAYPQKAEIIHKICHISRPIYLMYLQNLKVPLDSYLKMREYKRMQFAQRGQIV